MGGKKKSSAGTNAADTLYNQDILELGMGMCEGTIVGLDKGLKSLYANNIPVEAESGEFNFQDIAINIRQGYYDDLPINFLMGGESSVMANSMNLSLPADIPRTIVTPPQFRGKIKALDVRMIIQQLYAGDGKNINESSVIFQVKYRRVGDTNWRFVNETTLSLSEYKRKVATLRQEAERQGIVYDDLTPEAQYEFELETLKQLKNITAADLENLDLEPEKVQGETEIGVGGTYGRGIHGNSGAYIFKVKNYKSLAEVYSDQVTGVTSAELANEMIILNGKTSAGFIFELSIPIFDPSDSLHDWEVQIVRRSRELTSEEKKYSGKVISLESVAVTTENDKKYTKTAICHIVAQHTDRFSDIPDFTGDIKGLICDIPTNYNPESKSWIGVWDGYFKKGWTDNNALIAHEIIMNRDWGKRASEPQLKVDATSLMEAIKYCDTLVPDLNGEMKPRHTFNDAISAERDIDEYLKYILGSFHATSREIFGVYRFFVDQKSEPKFFVSAETALQTGIAYNRSDLASRFNTMRVSFKNKENNFEEDRRIVVDSEAQLRDGLIPYTFQAIGATNLSEAIRQAVYLMYTNKEETTFATFAQPRLGHVVNLYDHFYIADPEMDWGRGVRILNYNPANGVINLRDPLVMSAPTEWFTVYVHTYTGLETFTAYTLNPYTLQVDAKFITLGLKDYLFDEAPIALGNDTYGYPKEFRVLSIEQSSSSDVAQGELFTFKAAIVSDLKYRAIDNINDPSLVSFTFNNADATYDRKRVASMPRDVSIWLKDTVNDVGQLAYGLKFEASKNAARYEVAWVNKTTEELRQTIIYDSEATLSPASPEYTPLKLRITPFNVEGEAGDIFYMDDVILSYPQTLGLPRLISVTYHLPTTSIRFSFTTPNFDEIPNNTSVFSKMLYDYVVPNQTGQKAAESVLANYVDLPYKGKGTYKLQLKYYAEAANNNGYETVLKTIPWIYYGDDGGSLPVNRYPTPQISNINTYTISKYGSRPAPEGKVYVTLVLKIPNASSFPELMDTSNVMFFPFLILVSDENNGVYRRIGYAGGSRVYSVNPAEGLFSIDMDGTWNDPLIGLLPDATKVGARIRVKVIEPFSGSWPEPPDWTVTAIDSSWTEVLVPDRGSLDYDPSGIYDNNKV